VAAEPVLDALEWVGWTHKRIPIRFSASSRWGIRRLRIEAGLRRWRLFSVRYTRERAWVERWLHMIGRSLLKQPQAANAIVQTATMIEGHGAVYRQGLSDWHAIIDGLVKPSFDGVLPLPDLDQAIARARAAALLDPRQVALKRTIAEIRARALAGGTDAAD
jgi:MoxR-like ATPase